MAPSLITTVFPHLGERGVNEFRWALAVGLLVLLGLYVAGLITAAIIVAAVLIPTLYVLYLYEARIYRDAPLRVTLGTIGGGFLLGIVATIVLDGLVPARADAGAPRPGSGIALGPLLFTAVLLPITMEAIKPLPALLLRSRPDFAPSIDGLVFGIAAGLGYAAAETIIHFSAVIADLPSQTTPGLWVVPLVTVGILMPLLHGTATGLITASLWRVRGGKVPRAAFVAILMAVVGHVAFTLGGQLLEASGIGPVGQLIWQAVVVGALLIAIRQLLDRLLREEAAAMGLTEVTCTSCGSEITGAGFCTACGVALAATPHGTSAGDGSRAGRVAGEAR